MNQNLALCTWNGLVPGHLTAVNNSSCSAQRANSHELVWDITLHPLGSSHLWKDASNPIPARNLWVGKQALWLCFTGFSFAPCASSDAISSGYLVRTQT